MLIFWPNPRKAMLISVMLIKEKTCSWDSAVIVSAWEVGDTASSEGVV
jgi:hypothetical protein